LDHIILGIRPEGVMPYRRWRWVEDCDTWNAFLAWRDTRSFAGRVQLQAGLKTLLKSGPEHDTRRVGDGLYSVYAASGGTLYWLIVGVAQPGESRLLPLAWGTNATDAVIAEEAKLAADKLRAWQKRDIGGGR